jgi:hypothetical protein
VAKRPPASGSGRCGHLSGWPFANLPGAKRLIGHGLDHSHIVPEIAGSAAAPVHGTADSPDEGRRGTVQTSGWYVRYAIWRSPARIGTSMSSTR